ncbi:MAG: prepilin peptidase, partial [Paracoccaceae bacterium]
MILSDILLVTTAVLVAMAPMTASFLQCWADRARAGNPGPPEGRSHCDSCGKTLGAIDLVPVLSWLWNRGKARCCGQSLSPALLWPEAAALILALWGALAASSAFSAQTVALLWVLQAIVLLHATRTDVVQGLVALLALAGLAMSAGGLTGPFSAHAAGLALGLAAFAATRGNAQTSAYSHAALLLAASGALLGLFLLPVAVLIGAAL